MPLGPDEPARGSKPEARANRRQPLVHKGETISCSWRYEEEGWSEGRVAVAGLDEVGRGALCGPVVAGAVVLDRGFASDGIDDSKRLTRRQRERLALRIQQGARAWAIGQVEAWEIDRINILRATHLAMRRALEALGVTADLLLVDGASRLEGVEIPQRTIVKGDASSFSIAAASIVAKVARDGIMRAWDEKCPGYGLAENMGYGSRDHMEALARRGPSEIHRRSFAGTQPWLDFGEA
jgi:ribonuclease HII